MNYDVRRLGGLMTLALLFASTPGAFAEPAPPVKYEENWESLDSRPMPNWYGDSKFGIFIHWGVYSVPAFSHPDSYSEWYWHSLKADQSERSEQHKRNQAATQAFHNRVFGKNFEYKQFAPMFRAELFDPAQWADVFKRSGAKYVVLTSKHHDGFCLFPNEQANKSWGRPWNSVDEGPKRDLLGDLGDAVCDAGLKMGFYYSLYEWFNPLWLSDRERFVDEHMIPQFKDVVTRYKPSIIFSDGEWEMEHEKWKSTELLAWLFNESPSRDEVVITSKHHDGFCLFPNEQANKSWGRPWNSVDEGPKRDLLGDLGDAVCDAGLKMGFYYSLYEWFNPLWLSDRERFVDEHMIPQFKDVVTRYKPSIIFSDGEWEMEHEKWKSTELLAWLFNESPSRDEVVINDRWGKSTRHKHGGYFTTEYGVGMKDASYSWEENRGMGMSYGYNRNEPLSNYKSVKELVLVLIDLVSRGGNFLLDVGPTADSRIPEIMEDRLIEIGKWLDVNGEAIFGTKTWQQQVQWTEGEQPNFEYKHFGEEYDILQVAGMKSQGGKARKQVFYTKKPGALYAITPGWPEKELILRGVKPAANTVVTMLGLEGSLGWQAAGDDLVIRMPSLTPDELPSRYAHAFKITGVE